MGDNIIQIGPVGSKHGDPWDEKGNTRIVQIFISHDDVINSIQFQYADFDGNLQLSPLHGSNYGDNFDVVKLKYPIEHITGISGHKNYNHSQLTSLKFVTNLGEYGPFGQFSDQHKEFNLKLSQTRQFGGFHGLADTTTVTSIGIYLNPTTTLDYSTLNMKTIAHAQAKQAGDITWEVLSE